jgi:hypothetical protein
LLSHCLPFRYTQRAIMLSKIFLVSVVATLLLLNSSAIASPFVNACSPVFPSKVVYSAKLANDHWCSDNSLKSNDGPMVEEFRFDTVNFVVATNCENQNNECSNVISPVSVPTSIWLFASGLGFIGIIRRRIHR